MGWGGQFVAVEDVVGLGVFVLIVVKQEGNEVFFGELGSVAFEDDGGEHHVVTEAVDDFDEGFAVGGGCWFGWLAGISGHGLPASYLH